MASAVIGIQLVTREAVGSGTTWKESSSELSVTLKIHLEVGKTIDRSACAASKRDSSSPPLPFPCGGRGDSWRNMPSTNRLPFEHGHTHTEAYELRNPWQILFSSRGGLWRCPSTTVPQLISHQESIPAETSISLEYGARWADLDLWISPQRFARERDRGYSILDSDACPPRPFFASLPSYASLSSRVNTALSSLSRTVDLTKENWKRRIRSAVIASHV